jgi:hypothetical protein
VSTSITSNRPWPVAAPEDAGDNLATAATEPALLATGTHPLRRIAGILEDAVLLLLAVFLFPLIILLVGTTIALFVRGMIEIAHRL